MASTGPSIISIELGWQAKCDYAKLILSHKDLTEPYIREPAETYGKRGLKFRGSETQIRLYDKSKEREAFFRRVPVPRIEVQLLGRKLKELFDHEDGVCPLPGV